MYKADEQRVSDPVALCFGRRRASCAIGDWTLKTAPNNALQAIWGHRQAIGQPLAWQKTRLNHEQTMRLTVGCARWASDAG